MRQRHPGEYITTPHLTSIYVGFNLNRPPFADQRVRRAFALATDVNLYANVMRRGHHPLADGGLIPAGLPGHSPGIRLPFEPEQARQLLAEAGYGAGRALPPIDLLVSDFRQKEAEHLVYQWQDHLGIEVGFTVVDQLLPHEILDASQPTIFFTGWTADYPDPDNFLRVCIEATLPTWHHPEYKALITQTRRATDQTQRLALCQAADQLLVEEVIIVPLTYTRGHLLIKPRIKTFPLATWAGVRFIKHVVVE